MYSGSSKMNRRMFKIRKPAGMKLHKPLIRTIVEEEEKEEVPEQLQEAVDVADMDVFQLLIDEMNSIKSKRKLEKFVLKNKSDINSLSSSARHTFLNLMKDKFY